MPPPPIIDPIALKNLQELSPDDGGVFFRDIVGIFLADTPLRIAELEESFRSADAPKVTRAAHSIKGSSANLGADRLRAVAERVERESQDKPIAQLAPILAEVREEFALARDELQRILAVGL